MAGLSHFGGPLIEGWAEVRESVQTILSTRIGTRVMRREFGSTVPDLVDANPTDAALLALFVAAAEALERWEPRFDLQAVDLGGPEDYREAFGEDPAEAMAAGRFALRLSGVYYPRGHLGDFSLSEADRRLAAFIR